jgi:type I restriction enzyme S subunit
MRLRYEKLENIAVTTSGGTPTRGVKAYYGGKIPWIKSGELNDGEIVNVDESITEDGLKASSAKLLPSGTLLIAMYGATVGRLGLLGFPAATNQAVCAITPSDCLDRDYLFHWLLNKREDLVRASFGGAQPNISQTVIRDLEIPFPELSEQRSIAARLSAKLTEAANARQAVRTQLREISSLAGAIVMDTIQNSPTKPYLLGDVLDEVKQGIGASWADHPVLGATREGLAPAKEQPGKMAPKYKPVTPGTVFYNPMRILIGSIAFVDEDDTPGITSPDYVALRGKPGLVDSRWFYYWLRSHQGAQCILSLARGAVRERMLFTRLADGKIDLPSPEAQEKASRALRELKPLQRALKSKLAEIDLLPQKILAQAFEM